MHPFLLKYPPTTGTLQIYSYRSGKKVLNIITNPHSCKTAPKKPQLTTISVKPAKNTIEPLSLPEMHARCTLFDEELESCLEADEEVKSH